MSKTIAAIVLALVIGLLAGSLIGIRSAETETNKEVLSTDIEMLRSHPASFAGRSVRLSGKLDQCFAFECSLCPEEMTSAKADPKRCLPLDFRPLISKTGFGEEEQESVFRFSSVEVVAHFDPSCWKAPCLDRASVLTDAKVEEVKTRRSSRDGLWLGVTTRLKPAPLQTAAVIRAEALRAGFPPQPIVRVFEVDGNPGLAVVCWTAVGMDSWPDSLEGAVAARSINDYYRCNEVRHAADRWIVQVTG